MIERQLRSRAVSDAEALALVMEMMAIPGRSGEEAAVMDFIRAQADRGRRAGERDWRSTTRIAARRSAGRSATSC